MKTYMTWLARLLFLLTAICLIAALLMFFGLSPVGLDGAGATAILYSTILGVFGFGISAFAAYIIGQNINNS